MKTKIFTLTLALFLTVMLNAQTVPNGGFEAWTDGEPDEWFTSNFTGVNTIKQSDDSHSGSYAARGQSREFQNTNITPDLINTGTENGPGFPITQDYDLLTFYYKFDDGVLDRMLGFAIIRDADFDKIGEGYFEVKDNQETWKKGIIPIVYDGSGAAYCTIQFILVDQAGGEEPSLDSWFIVDDIELSTVTDIEELKGTPISIYPNPASDVLNIKLSEATEQISLMNIAGQVVYNASTDSEKFSINLNQFDKGVYFLKIESDNGISTRKVIIQ